MDIRVKVGIVNERDEQFIGPGLVHLLDSIREHKSINKAAKSMGLSYKKAHRMITKLEADLKQPVLVKKRGGTERGGTEITPLGEMYIAEFKRLEQKVQQLTATEFRAFEKRIARNRRIDEY